MDLLVELWQKGLIWDNVIGYKLIQVDQLFQGQIAAQFNGYGATAPSKFHATRWFSLDADLLVAGGLDQPAIIGTKNPTPYQVLLDLRWELTGFVGGGGGGVIADPTGAGVGMGMGMGMMMDQGGGGGMHSRPFVEHSSVENYNKIDSYGSIIGYGSVAYEDMTDDYSRQPYDQPQHQQQHPYNNSEMYSSTSAYNNGLDEDALYNRLPPDNNGYDDDNRSYLMGNCEYILLLLLLMQTFVSCHVPLYLSLYVHLKVSSILNFLSPFLLARVCPTKFGLDIKYRSPFTNFFLLLL